VRGEELPAPIQVKAVAKTGVHGGGYTHSVIQKLAGLLRRARPAAAAAAWQGAPAQPRMKTHTAESGYVYHYYFDGWRESGAAREYKFTYSADRRAWAALVVELRPRPADLPDNVRYGVAKLALFEAFDQAAAPLHLAPAWPVDAETQARILERLGFE
jgi:hypothetical protein